MSACTRYAIFVVPPEGAFSEAGGRWLGWDSLKRRAHDAPHPKLTKTPRKYGFHGTIKPPFRLASGQSEAGLITALSELCRKLAPVRLEALELDRLGSFLAFIPKGDAAGLGAMAADVVIGLDAFRAPATEDELARRRKRELTARQEGYLTRWGYPYVLEEFRYHMTLTGYVPRDAMDTARAEAERFFAGLVPQPYEIDTLCLMGECAETKRFHLLERVPLSAP